MFGVLKYRRPGPKCLPSARSRRWWCPGPRTRPPLPRARSAPGDSCEDTPPPHASVGRSQSAFQGFVDGPAPCPSHLLARGTPPPPAGRPRALAPQADAAGRGCSLPPPSGPLEAALLASSSPSGTCPESGAGPRVWDRQRVRLIGRPAAGLLRPLGGSRGRFRPRRQGRSPPRLRPQVCGTGPASRAGPALGLRKNVQDESEGPGAPLIPENPQPARGRRPRPGRAGRRTRER